MKKVFKIILKILYWMIIDILFIPLHIIGLIARIIDFIINKMYNNITMYKWFLSILGFISSKLKKLKL